MKNFRNIKFYQGFTLVELIVVITILAILATIAFISFQGYISGARDTNRVSTISNIEKGLEISYVKIGNYPIPDNANSYTGGTAEIKQGVIGELTQRIINLNTIPLDPLTNQKYIYSISGNGKYYQIGAEAENLQSSILNTTYASSKYAIVKGNYTFDPSIPSLIVAPNSINPTSGLFDSNVCFIVNGLTNILSSSSGACIKKSQMEIKGFDANLVGYWDMETTFNSGGLTYLKDLSGNGNYGSLSGGISIGGVGGYIGKGTYFDGINKDISILNDKYGTGFNWFGNGTGETISYIFSINPTTTLDTTYMLTMTRTAEMTSCIGTGYLIFRDNKGNGITVQNYPINLGKFYLFTSTYDINTGKMRLYINGNLLAERLEGVFQPGGGDGYFHIGALSAGCSGIHFDGVLDEIKIYNRTLSNDEIRKQAKIIGM
ncbi:MAG: prepilin-type N-terminal cleavage/methylation domain-containing protein [Candidatus Gracilibacteria bacterium]|nr:prepilin-type N-terminal cleavage/methylation domain-containing protein [Candidatus Gracilibacteria bacterium]